MRNLIKQLGLTGLLLAAGAAGCQTIAVNEPAEKIDPTPALVDEATLVRSWPQTVAWYPDSRTLAGLLGFLWEPTPGINPALSGAIETPLFIANAIAAPIALCFAPPWTPVMWNPGSFAPTYSANPPLPPTTGPAVIGEGLTPGPTTIK